MLLLHGGSTTRGGRYHGFAGAGYGVYLSPPGNGVTAGRAGTSRFSQLLGDLQAFRRAIRRRHTQTPQILLAHSFGGLVALRYLETQPGDPIAAAVISSPWLALATPRPAWRLLAMRFLADVWPTLPIPASIDAALLSRDHAVNAAYEADPGVHGVMTPGAWREILWAQRAVAADGHRIDVSLLFCSAVKTIVTRTRRGHSPTRLTASQVKWYPEMFHEVLHDPQRDHVVADILTFLGAHGLG